MYYCTPRTLTTSGTYSPASDYAARYASDGSRDTTDKYFHSTIGTNSWLAVDLGTAGQQIASVTWYLHNTATCNRFLLDAHTSCSDSKADVDYSSAGTKIGGGGWVRVEIRLTHVKLERRTVSNG